MKLTKKNVSALLMAGLLAVPACLPFSAFAEEEPLVAAAPAPAANAYTIQIDGKQAGAEPVVMVPLRTLAEELGWTVTWQTDTRTVRVDTGDVYTIVTPNLDEYFITTSHEDMVGMSAPFSLGLAPYISGGTTYAPLSLFDALIGVEGAVTVDGSIISIHPQGSIGDVGEQIPNPFQDCASMDQARTVAGFDFQVPASVDGYPEQTIQAIDGSMIQVFYANDDADVLLRKGTGSEDISGDYNSYAETKTVQAGGVTVTLKGNDGKFFCAVWTDGGYSFAIDARNGLTEDAMLSLAASMK